MNRLKLQVLGLLTVSLGVVLALSLWQESPTAAVPDRPPLASTTEAEVGPTPPAQPNRGMVAGPTRRPVLQSVSPQATWQPTTTETALLEEVYRKARALPADATRAQRLSQIAKAGAAVMRKLIMEDPQAAYNYALPAKVWKQLPADIQPLVARRFDEPGIYVSYISCEEHTLQRSIKTETLDTRLVSATDDVARQHSTLTAKADVRGVALEKLAGVVSLDNISGLAEGGAADGGATDGEGADEGAPDGGAASYSPWRTHYVPTLGSFKALVIISKFSNESSYPTTISSMENVMSQSHNKYLEYSYNQLGMTYDVIQVDLAVDDTVSDYTFLRETADAAEAAGYNPDNYDVIMRRNSDRGNYAWFNTKDSFLRKNSYTTTMHEIGHNMDLEHANWWQVDAGQPGWSEHGVNRLYAEDFDMMSNSPRGDYNAWEKAMLDWLTVANGDYAEDVADGVYRIYPYDNYNGNFNTSGVDGAYYFVTVYKDAVADNQPASQTGDRAPREYVLSMRNQPEHNNANNPWFTDGLLLHWKPWTEEGSSGYGDNAPFGTSLVDTKAHSDTNGELGEWRSGKNAPEQYDAPVLIGETYLDDDPDNRDGKIYITPLRKTDPDGTPRSGDEYIDVKIVRGDQFANQAPTANWNISATSIEIGGTITVTVTANDPDDTELGYFWDFGLGTDGAARRAMPLDGNPSQTFTYAAGGSYLLKCIVTDGRGGTVTLQQLISVSNDTDSDGLDDDWEMLYFGDLDETGTGDPDNDGVDNLTEQANGSDPTVDESLIPPAAPTNLVAIGGDNSVSLDWDDNTELDFTGYSVYRSTTPGSYDATPLVAGLGGSNYVDDTAVNGTTYYYVVTAVDSDANESPASNEQSAFPTNGDLDEDGLPDPWELTYFNNLYQGPNDDFDSDGFTNLTEYNDGTDPTVVPTEVRVTGSVIGTPGSYGGGDTIDNVFDGDLNTYYDAANASGDWAGLDLGTPRRITRIRYAARASWGSRMDGGRFQGSNTADFSSGVETFYTISGSPPAGVLTDQVVTSSGSYRYVRYIGPDDGWCNVAEVEFHAEFVSPAPDAPTGLSALAENGRITLDWDDNGDVDWAGYSVYRSNASGSYGPALMTGLTDSAYVDTDVTNGNLYFYIVRAVDTDGYQSTYSNEVSETPRVRTTPAVNAGPDQSAIIEAGVAWTPANLDTAGWYDASDTGTVMGSGGSVSQWNDKSGKGLHLRQLNGTQQPVTGSTTINGMNAIDFDGSDDALVSSSNPFGTTIEDGFVIAVHKVDTLSSGTLFSLTGSDSATFRWQAHAPYSSTAYMDCGGINNGHRISTGYGVSAGDNVLASFYCSTTDNVQQIYKNGALLTGDSSGHSVSTSSNIYIGSSGGSQYQDSSIGEIIIINGTVSTEDRQKLEGYLAHKWGLAGELPADHPYKQEAPGAPGVRLDLDATVTDADGDTPATNWTQVSGPAAVIFGDASAIDTDVVLGQPGEYILRLTADDGLAQAYDEIRLHIVTAGDDSDNDSIDDSWEVTHFGGTAVIDGSADSDGDRVQDFFEYIYGSFPNDSASSGFTFKVGANQAGNGAVLQWTVKEGFALGTDYEVEISTDLSTWNTLPANHYSVVETTEGGKTTVELEVTEDYGGQVFLRLSQP